jgi:hypothetical protein
LDIQCCMFLWTLVYPSCTSNGCSNFWRFFCPWHCMWHNLKLVYFLICVYMLGEAIKLRFRQPNACKSSHSFVSLKSSGWSTGNGWGHSNSKLYLIWIVVGKYKVKFPCTIPMKTDPHCSLITVRELVLKSKTIFYVTSARLASRAVWWSRCGLSQYDQIMHLWLFVFQAWTGEGAGISCGRRLIR